MSLTFADIITGARQILHDQSAGAYRWDDTVMLAKAGKAQREIVKGKPDEASVRKSLQLTAGKALHAILPDTAWQIIDVVCNMGEDGESPGPTVNYAERSDLDRADRKWHLAPPSTTIYNWLRDRSDIRRFYTYPTAHPLTRVWVELIYADTPAMPTATTDKLVIRDIQQTAIELVTAGLALMEDDPKADIPRGTALIKSGFDSLRMSAGAEQIIGARAK